MKKMLCHHPRAFPLFKYLMAFPVCSVVMVVAGESLHVHDNQDFLSDRLGVLHVKSELPRTENGLSSLHPVSMSLSVLYTSPLVNR